MGIDIGVDDKLPERVNCPNCTGQAILIDIHPNMIGDIYKCLQCNRCYSKGFISGYQIGLKKGQSDSRDSIVKLQSQLLESKRRVENLTLKHVRFSKDVQIEVQTQHCAISASDVRRIIAETCRRRGTKYEMISPKEIDGTYLVWTGAKIHRKDGTPVKYHLSGYSRYDVGEIIEWLHSI